MLRLSSDLSIPLDAVTRTFGLLAVRGAGKSNAAAAGYTDGGGAFNNPRGRLRSLGLIEYPERGMVRARDILFLEGR